MSRYACSVDVNLIRHGPWYRLRKCVLVRTVQSVGQFHRGVSFISKSRPSLGSDHAVPGTVNPPRFNIHTSVPTLGATKRPTPATFPPAQLQKFCIPGRNFAHISGNIKNRRTSYICKRTRSSFPHRQETSSGTSSLSEKTSSGTRESISQALQKLADPAELTLSDVTFFCADRSRGMAARPMRTYSY